MAKTVVHLVLEEKRNARADYRPIMTRDPSDNAQEIAEDFLAERCNRITEARRSGAPRPVFRVMRQTATADDQGKTHVTLEQVNLDGSTPATPAPTAG